MEEAIKSGKEILDEFFSEIKQIPNVDQKLAEALALLYRDQKFTEKQILNALQASEGEKSDDKN
jgi:hypothetical protein